MVNPKSFAAHLTVPGFFLLFVFIVQGCATVAPTMTFPVGNDWREAFLCRPKGSGPFAAVVYNHGSIVDSVGVGGAAARGNNLTAICQALAEEGFLAFFPVREKAPRGKGYSSYQADYKEIASRAIDHIKTFPDVDPSRVALMGHSMGGLITLLLGIERKDLKALVVTAPAAGPRVFADAISYADSFTAPLLLLVETGDASRILRGVELLEQALKKHGKEARVIRYSRGGRHELFFDVDYYWDDVRTFLREKLSPTRAQ